jgi:hypothetical protein
VDEGEACADATAESFAAAKTATCAAGVDRSERDVAVEVLGAFGEFGDALGSTEALAEKDADAALSFD